MANKQYQQLYPMYLRLLIRKYLRSYPEWVFHPPHVQVTRRLTRVGSDYGGYFLDTAIFPHDPVIYSAGIGFDISFDLGLIQQFGCIVNAFYPTPKVQAWIDGQSLWPKFRFHAVGSAALDS